MLVYQGGIANVFQVDCANLAPFGRNAVRLFQSDFRACEHFARGCGTMGAIVHSVHCNKAGDIIRAVWDGDLDNAPFRDSMLPVTLNTKGF